MEEIESNIQNYVSVFNHLKLRNIVLRQSPPCYTDMLLQWPRMDKHCFTFLAATTA